MPNADEGKNSCKLCVFPSFMQFLQFAKPSVLLLLGANTWSNPKRGTILNKASEFLSMGAPPEACCGQSRSLSIGVFFRQTRSNPGMSISAPASPNRFMHSCKHCQLQILRRNKQRKSRFRGLSKPVANTDEKTNFLMQKASEIKESRS